MAPSILKKRKVGQKLILLIFKFSCWFPKEVFVSDWIKLASNCFQQMPLGKKFFMLGKL